MSSGHTHNRNGRGNQRRKHGPPRQQPQNGQSQNSQQRNGQPKQQNGDRVTPTMSTTALPTHAEAPFQAPDDRSTGRGGEFAIDERVTREIAEVVREAEAAPPLAVERAAPAPPRPTQQRNTQPPGKRGAFLVSSERQNGAVNGARPNGLSSQHTMQHSSIPRGTDSTPHVQPASPPAPAEPFVIAEPPTPANLPPSRRVEYDGRHPNTYAMQPGEARYMDDEDAAHERLPLRDVRGDIGGMIDSLHELFAQDRGIASQGNATRCGICYLHYPLSELEYREVEGYYVCVACKRALGSTQLMMVRRQQKN